MCYQPSAGWEHWIFLLEIAHLGQVRADEWNSTTSEETESSNQCCCSVILPRLSRVRSSTTEAKSTPHTFVPTPSSHNWEYQFSKYVQVPKSNISKYFFSINSSNSNRNKKNTWLSTADHGWSGINKKLHLLFFLSYKQAVVRWWLFFVLHLLK